MPTDDKLIELITNALIRLDGKIVRNVRRRRSGVQRLRGWNPISWERLDSLSRRKRWMGELNARQEPWRFTEV